MFETPEKQTDGSYIVKLVEPIEICEEFMWKRGDARPIVDLKGQMHIQSIRENLLTRLAQNKSLFKTAPSVASLRAITPVWGMLVHSQNRVDWSSQDIWMDMPRDSDIVVVLRLMGVQISRQSILPIWAGHVRRTLPEAGQIDLDFEGEEDEGESVHSDELEEEDGQAMHLKDPAELKRQMKTYVRNLLREASEVRMKADAALDRFYAEYDLSENESEFSEEDD